MKHHNITLPSDNAAEQMLIAACLLRPTALSDAREKIRHDDFNLPLHGVVWRTMCDLADANREVGMFNLRNEMRKRGTLTDDAKEYIEAAFSPNAAMGDTAECVAIVADRSLRRRQIIASNESMLKAVDLTLPADQALDMGQSAIMAVSPGDMGKVRRSLAEVGEAAWSSGVNQSEGKRGLTMGFEAWDSRTRGMRPGNLVAIVGRSGMGKTALAVKIADHNAIEKFKNVVFFEGEMAAEDLYLRMLSSRTQLTTLELERRLSEKDLATAKDVATTLHNQRIQIVDTANTPNGITPTLIRSECRSMKRTQGLDLVIVDYLELMQAEAKIDNEVQRLDYLIRSLKSIAIEFHCVVVVLCQMKEASQQRPDKHPQLGDIRGSGGIAAALDLAFGIYNINEYARREKPDMMRTDPDMRKADEVEINCLKARSDVRVNFRASFVPAYTLYYDPDPSGF